MRKGIPSCGDYQIKLCFLWLKKCVQSVAYSWKINRRHYFMSVLRTSKKEQILICFSWLGMLLSKYLIKINVIQELRKGWKYAHFDDRNYKLFSYLSSYKHMHNTHTHTYTYIHTHTHTHTNSHTLYIYIHICIYIYIYYIYICMYIYSIYIYRQIDR